MIPPTYYINYRLGNENVRVMDYNRATRVYTPTSYADGRLEITATEFVVNGTAAMSCDGGEVTIPTLTHKGAPKKANVPYIEFIRKATSVPVVVATLSKEGILYVDRVNEENIPDTTDQMLLSGVSISQNGLTAPTIVEQDL